MTNFIREHLRVALLCICIFSSVNFLSAQGVAFEWAHHYGSTHYEGVAGMETDPQGNVIVSGIFGGTIDFDPGTGVQSFTAQNGHDGYILKYDSTGNFLWAKHFSYFGSSRIKGLHVDHNGDIYLGGYFTGVVDFDLGSGVHNAGTASQKNLFLLKLDNNGDFEWVSVQACTSSAYIEFIDTDTAGNVYAAGNYYDSLSLQLPGGTTTYTSNGSFDFFVLKHDANGTLQWGNVYEGSDQSDMCNDLVVDDKGMCYMAGRFADTVDFDLTANTHDMISNGDLDAFILKLNTHGSLVWVKQFGGTSSDMASTIAYNPNGDLAVAGTFYGTVDFDPGTSVNNLSAYGNNDLFIMKLDTNGTYFWAKEIGSSWYGEDPKDIEMDPAGNIYLTGGFTGSCDFDPGPGTHQMHAVYSDDGFTLKLNTNGDFKWAKHHYSNNSVIAFELVLGASQRVIIGGIYRGTFDLDPGPDSLYVTGLGHSDMFVLSMSGCDSDTIIQTVHACDSFTWINGVTYTSDIDSVYYSTYTTGGCDSVVRLDLSLSASTSTIEYVTACSPYLWTNGVTYTQSTNLPTDTFVSSSGCDSIVRLNLSYIAPPVGTDVQTACNSFTWINGQTYTSSVSNVVDTISTVAGCDSIVILDLTIITIDTSVTVTWPTLMSNQHGAQYQWLDCDNAYQAIQGAQTQAFTAVQNGNYAVEISEGPCVDTSSCHPISSIGIQSSSDRDQYILVYPNPSQGEFNIRVNGMEEFTLSIYSPEGKRVFYRKEKGALDIFCALELAKGVYMLEYRSENKVQRKQLVIQ